MGFLSGKNKSEVQGAENPNLDNVNNNVNNSYQNQVLFSSALNPNSETGIANQQTLAQMLLAQSQGQGPNPAQLQYNKNIAGIAGQQAGAISSQKGISPALAAQLISQQGGQAMQGGAANSAILQAQQQLAAQQGLMDLSNQMILQKQNANNSQIQGAIGQQGNVFGMQQNANDINQKAQNQNALLKTEGIKSGLQALSGAGQIAAGGGAAHGAYIPGNAEVPGDSVQNDKVQVLLSPGEVVVPRSLVENPEAAKKFIEQISKKKSKGTYADVLKAKRSA